MRRSRTAHANPVFYAERLAETLDDSDRVAAARADPANVDLLTWNVFASLNTHRDPEWLARKLQPLAGSTVRAPVRMSFWTGRNREPLLQPSHAYRAALRERSPSAGHDGNDLSPFEEPIEVPVRMESPDALVLIDTVGTQYPRGAGGRDRLLELIDAGLDHARRLSRPVTVTVVYPSGTSAAGDLSARINGLRDPGTLNTALPHLSPVGPVGLREMSWQRLLQLWDTERPHLDLDGQPVKAFLAHLRQRGLR